MSTDKDREQDELIRTNAEHIRKNEEAIRRQTECLEKIRDHYFPRKTVWRRTSGFVLKVVGALTVYTGLMEAADWYWNTRQSETMAKNSANVAKCLFFNESDTAGAVHFLEKAVELDNGTVRYRIALAYVKGIATIADLFDLGRPFTAEERTRVDKILAEATFLQQTSPDEPMPFVLAAQARVLRGEYEAAQTALRQAIEKDPSSPIVRIGACAMSFASGNMSAAREHLAEAVKLNAKIPFVHYWTGMIALVGDSDLAAAKAAFDEFARKAPNLALAKAMVGRMRMLAPKPDFAAARAAFKQALVCVPNMALACLWMSETYEREGNRTLARLWLDNLLKHDPHCMKALAARARLHAEDGNARAAADDLTTALELAPFRADLYRARAKAHKDLHEDVLAKADLEKAQALEKDADVSR